MTKKFTFTITTPLLHFCLLRLISRYQTNVHSYFMPSFYVCWFYQYRIHSVGRIIFLIKRAKFSGALYRWPTLCSAGYCARVGAVIPASVLLTRGHLRLFNDIILMEYMAHKMAVIEFMHQLTVNFRGKYSYHSVSLRRNAISSARISSTSSE